MKQLVRHHLSGVHLVVDTFLAPSHAFLGFVCRQAGENVVVLSLDTPAHRLTWPDRVRVIDRYGGTLDDVAEEPQWDAKQTIVIVDGITRLLGRHGVGLVLDRLLALKEHCACLLLTVHGDCVDRQVLAQVEAACSSGQVTMLPDNVVAISGKRKGGKVAKSRERVTRWEPLESTMLSAPADSDKKAELKLEDADMEAKERLALPFVKTAVSGKMIFDVEDMEKQGDYEDDADKSSGEEEDPDADLDI